MLLNNTPPFKKCLQCVHFNVVFLFKHKKKNLCISKRYTSSNGIFEKATNDKTSSFKHEREKYKKNDVQRVKNLQYFKNAEDKKSVHEIMDEDTYSRKKVEETQGISFREMLVEDQGMFAEKNETTNGHITYNSKDQVNDDIYENSKQINSLDVEDEYLGGDDEPLREEGTEEFEDDLDTLLFTNNLNSSLIGNLWHASANSAYKESWKKNSKITNEGNKNKEGDLHIYHDEKREMKHVNINTTDMDDKGKPEYIDEKDKSLGGKRYEQYYRWTNDDVKEDKKEINYWNLHQQKEIENGSINNFHFEKNMVFQGDKMNEECEYNKKNDLNSFINEICKEEQKEVEKMKQFFEKNEKHLMKFRNSTLCKLKISEELPKKFKHLSKDTNVFNNEKSKEEHYKKLINGLNYDNSQEAYYRKKKKQKNVNYDHIETLKILDIDSVPCDVLNQLFAYKIVKNCSAELCLKIISRIGMYRDKYSQVSYENMINYLGKTINSNSNAEIIALFSRCYETVSIPFLVNFVRKYATFSRSFIVSMYDKYFKKRLFDFVRYENNMGIRKIPNILTHPYHLSSYIKLLGECSAKKDMYIQLKMRGHIPHSGNYNDERKINQIDCLTGEVNYLSGEMNYLTDETINNKNKKITIMDDKKKSKKKKNYVQRPKMYDVILSAEYTGLPIEHFIEKEKFINVNPALEKELQHNNHNLLNSPDNIVSNGEQIECEEEVKYIENLLIPKNEERHDTIADVKPTFTNNRECVEQPTYQINNENEKNEERSENINFTLEEDCDIYLYKGFNKLNKSSLKLQTTLVKSDDNNTDELALCLNQGEHYEEIDKEQSNEALWELPWKTRRKNSFFFKGRFFKILPDKGWLEIKDISNQYIRPKRKRTKHFIRRKRVLQKKIKINLLKKYILEK
ncbi:conserved Plasmodium protein, unknown function [Plasmodium gonderi]|uniref:Uncharacterized protein n=1 Tax=Plasmodium gonderi TaxID=77519 RepID=A0A1Y1JUB9_PLAGO|nr:conserved Plasmodium protein, unknown function [Plasmodium gonderi]GAW83504.1 conserved Plasmodium protein, unknown function [Plasmodium gonderi]